MGNSEEVKSGESLEIRVVRRGNVVQPGGERSYGFILLLLAAIGIFVYMKWFNKTEDDRKSGEKSPAVETTPSKPVASGSGRSGQYDIPIPSESGRK